MNIGYAIDYQIHEYQIIEHNLEDIDILEFEKRAREIDKEYHPVRYVFLEDKEHNIIAMFRNNKVTVNKIGTIDAIQGLETK